MYKVLFVDNSNYFTGAFKSMLQIAGNAKETDYVFCMPESSKATILLKNKGYTVYPINFREINKSFSIVIYPLFLLINTVKLLRIVKQERIQIVHMNDMYNLLGVVLKVFYPKIIVVYHARLVKNSYIKPIYSLLVWLLKKNVNKIIAVSEAVKKDFGAPNNLDVVYDALNVCTSDSSLCDENNDDKLTILYMANFVPGKGHLDALEALSYIIIKNPEIKILMVGNVIESSENYYHQVLECVKERQLDNHVTIKTDIISTEEIYRSADIFLNLSRSESFSFTTLEALCQAAAVIASDVGGIPELFEDGEGGILVEVGNIPMIVEALEKLISDKGLRDSVRLRGQQYAREKFSLSRQTHQIQAIYESLLA